MKVIWKGITSVESKKTITIEGNQYFPCQRSHWLPGSIAGSSYWH